MERTFYYAVSKSGQGRVFTSMPERDEHFGVWVGEQVGAVSSFLMLLESDGFELPPLRWSDEPIPILLYIEIQDFSANES